MIETQQIGNFTELICGGGNVLTYNYATCFPQFFTRKILVGGESVDDFREVTAAERAALEARAEAWVRPPQEFITDFNYLANRVANGYGRYNESTGYFELGDVKDITYAQARKIVLSAGSWVIEASDGSPSALYAYSDIRVPFPVRLSGGGHGYSKIAQMFAYSNVEEVCFKGGFVNMLSRTFEGCTKLRKIVLNSFTNITNADLTFNNCPNLEVVEGLKFGVNVSFQHSPKLTYETVSGIIALAAKSITVTVHKDTYAKITGDTTNSAYNNLSDNDKERWTGLLAAAVEKNIQFATT